MKNYRTIDPIILNIGPISDINGMYYNENGLDVDIINKETAPTVRASLIGEGANIPTTEEADEILHKMGVHIVPDFIAN